MKKLFLAMAFLLVFALPNNGRGSDESETTPLALSPITFIAPAKDEIIHPSQTGAYNIQWDSSANPDAVLFKLYYSMDNGTTWRSAPGGKVLGPNLTVPIPPPDAGNKWVRLKINGYNEKGVKVAKGVSEPFYLEVIKVLSPNLQVDGPFQGKTQGTISWQLWETVDPVRSVKLYYTCNGGATWKKIASLGAPYNAWYSTQTYNSFTWPTVTNQKTKCKVKVVVVPFPGQGDFPTMGNDASDEFFTINP